MAENFQNFYVTKLREACDAVATTIYVDTVPAITEGTLVIEYANSTKHEIIHFTGVSGYGLTGCTRGMEGTTAQSHSAGVDVRQNLTAGMIDKIINGVITTENIANSAVTTAKINDGAVTADKIDFTTLSGNYSTTEVDTGFTWVDGKHIYKKTYTGTLGSRDFNVALGFTPKQVIKVEGGITTPDYGFQPFQRALKSSSEQTSYCVQVGDIKTACHFQIGDSVSTSSTYILTIWYTKNS